MTISDNLQWLIIAALVLHTITMLVVNTNNFLSHMWFKAPAVFSGILAAVMIAKVV